ncbi:PLP-dependent aminotransferase family protein [Cognatishimia sp.]|uniref:MocR-like pyridoxine biosynthesis transcription factor PdxR n=1 Tax=Cognatishimia sp. TaxID=2211648 RepID=UPI003518C07E
MSSSWLAFTIDRDLKTPVFEQICDALRNDIRSGAKPKGTKLPPTRSFAQELGVSRSTVVTAYEQLVAEGYIEGRQGAGYEVSVLDTPEIDPSPAPRGLNSLPPEDPPYGFLSGNPDMRLFPYRAWAKTVARVARRSPEDLLVSQSLQGYPALRTAIADHVREWRGVTAAPEQIFVTAGSIEGLELCLRTLSRAGDPIALENPGYLPMRRQVQAMGMRTVDMALDAQGACLPREDATFAVLTPSHQYPLGGTMSATRRQDFLRWASDTESWIVEDDYDSEFRFSGRPIPAMAGFDRLNRTIYVGSFSKVFSSGLRLGYVIPPLALRDKFAQTLRHFGSKASATPQPPLAEFMQSGEFYRHLRRVRRHYGRRRAFLLERLAQDFSDVGEVVDYQAGMQIVLHLKPDLDDRHVETEAARHGVTVQALSQYYAGTPKGNGLVLGYCGMDETETTDALSILRRVFDAARPKEKGRQSDPF